MKDGVQQPLKGETAGMQHLFVDIGAENREDALRMVRLGDACVYAPELKKVPMALVDYKEQDWKALKEYRQFNRELTERVTDHVCEVQDRAREFVTREQLESPMSARRKRRTFTPMLAA